MKILVQWALSSPGDWQEVDSADWAKLPKGPEPTALSPAVDAVKRWVHGLNVQGILLMGCDHYAVQEITDGVRVTVWNDDQEDWPNDRHAWSWVILEPAMDARVGQINTRQIVEVYAENPVRLEQYQGIDNAKTFSWKDFKAPPANVVRHGVWVSDPLNDGLIAAQTSHGWREWINA